MPTPIVKRLSNLFILFGSSRGIGQAFFQYASQFAGNDFILINRRAQKNLLPGRQTLTIDLSKPLSRAVALELQTIFSKQARHKNIYLILNASMVEPIKTIGVIKETDLFSAVHVNFLNYAAVINIFIKATSRFKSARKILAISSGAAASPQPGLSAYCSAKAALEMFIRCLSLEQKKMSGVKALAFRPGVVDTEMQKKIRLASKNDFPQVDKYKKIYNQKKLSAPMEVARKVYSLFSQEKYWSNPVIDINELE